MKYDTRVKIGQYISTSLEIIELFSFASPIEILNALKVYASQVYIYSAWATNVRLTWSVPRSTRSYLSKQVLSPVLEWTLWPNMWAFSGD
jgi:hypothetical protein